MTHRFTHEDVTLPLLSSILHQAAILHLDHQDTQTLEIFATPDVSLVLPKDRRWLTFACEFPLSSSMFQPPSPQVTEPELFHANVIHELFPMLQVSFKTDPRRAFRFSYSARLEGGMSPSNLLNCLRTFQDLVDDAVEPLRQKASN